MINTNAQIHMPETLDIYSTKEILGYKFLAYTLNT